jgi:hypothetical protein
MADDKKDCFQCHDAIHARLDGLNEKIADKEKQTILQVAAIKESLAVAKVELDRRLAMMNEFRQQLTDQAATFINRDEHNALISRIDTKVDNLEKGFNEKIDLVTKPINDKLKSVEAFYNQKVGARIWEIAIVTVSLSALVSLILRFVFKV